MPRSAPWVALPCLLVVVDRIERHDVVNAILLAAVLLLLGWGILTAADSLAATVDEGLVESTKEPEVTDTVPNGASTSTEPVEEIETDTSNLAEPRPPAEVTVRVANGARRVGVAGAGTTVVDAEGYATLAPKNGPTMDNSVVYYISGYAADAAAVAGVLGLDPEAIAPMPADPGVPIDGAHVIALLGVNSDY